MLTAALHLAAATLVCLLWPDPVPPAIFGLALALSLAPDLDTPKSLPGRLLPALSTPLERAIGHRTATHSALALGLIALVAWTLAPAWWSLLTLAYASHLLIDLLVGEQGLMLFWPVRAWLTIAAWRDDGPVPRWLLSFCLLAIVTIVIWPSVSWAVPVETAAALNPIATPTPTAPNAMVSLSFTLPAGVNLSSLRVVVGDSIQEGQILAHWEPARTTPIPIATMPAVEPSPAPPTLPSVIAVARTGDQTTLIQAQAALEALQTTLPAERAALRAAQQREVAAAQRELAVAQRELGELQPQHEREQAEQQHAVAAAQLALADAQAAAALVPAEAGTSADPAATQRATERIHAAEVMLQQALDAQDRMRTAQGIERAALGERRAQAQADLDTLPSQQARALGQLDAEQQAALIVARGRLAAAQLALNAEASRQASMQQQLAATAAARGQELLATATVQARDWREQVTATALAHARAVAATQTAHPTPQPNQVISRASGQVVGISAEERDGTLVVTLEVTP